MLQALSIKNFAIIDHVSVSFEKGLTVLTGETGAGKSIIIDALHLLVGGRGSSEYVRYGAKKAEIEGLFILEENDHPVYSIASEFGIEIEEGTLILRREISDKGKSICRINGKFVTISILREIGSTLVDIHSQHENQVLMNDAIHLSLLDQFGGEEIAHALGNYQTIYRKYMQIKEKINELKINEQQIAQRIDLLQFQLNELEQANLKIGEDKELEAERKFLSNFEKIFNALSASYTGLQGENHGLDFLANVLGHLETAADLDEQYQEIYETVANAYYTLEDVANQLRDQLEMLEFNPERLNEIESRLFEINQLKRKYGKEIEEILEYYSKIDEELETLLNREERLEQLQKQLSSIKEDLLIEGQNLTTIRKKWAKKLEDAIHQELKELYMDKTVFHVMFSEDNQDIRKDGLDEVSFYLSTNPGEPLKPLSKIASGGELSRIMIALKTIFTRHQGITSIIFDEVDTGVSGRVAQAIGEKIYQISINSQVLCISHLPQVAAMSDHHLFISKTTEDGRTKTQLTYLNDEEKIEEISRMISGSEITDVTKEHARELLERALQLK